MFDIKNRLPVGGWFYIDKSMGRYYPYITPILSGEEGHQKTFVIALQSDTVANDFNKNNYSILQHQQSIIMKGIINYSFFLLYAISVNSQTVHPFIVPDNSGSCFNSNYDSSYAAYAGRYKKDDFNILIVEFKNGGLTLRPMFWTTTQHLKFVSADNFTAVNQETRTFYFKRNSSNQVIEVELKGFRNEAGNYKKLAKQTDPLEDIFRGNTNSGVADFINTHIQDTTELLKIAQTLSTRFSTKAFVAEQFLFNLKKCYPGKSEVYTLLAEAYLFQGKRNDAIKYYNQALKYDPGNRSAANSLKMLKVIPYTEKEENEKWKIPFSLEALFSKPKDAEIRDIEKEWLNRDLSVKELKLINSQSTVINGMKVSLSVISHRVHGFLHYAAIIIPENITTGKHPAILELKGVSAGYSPLTITSEIETPPFLCREADQFIYLLPSYRGEKLIVNGKEYLSEGDRSNSWDGATDDALALLNAAVNFTALIDTDRTGVFGRSRGGSVALLAGVRDKRIKQVVALSGPTDWFSNMNLGGYKQEELVDFGLHKHSTPFETGGQFIERILKKNIAGEDGLKEARKRMIAGSALYFIDKFRNVQVHYGIEDRMVPVVNGASLFSAAKKKKLNLPGFEYFFHATEGHDTDKNIYYPNARRAFLSLLG